MRLGPPGARRGHLCTLKRTFESPHVGGATFAVKAPLRMILGALESYDALLAFHFAARNYERMRSRAYSFDTVRGSQSETRYITNIDTMTSRIRF